MIWQEGHQSTNALPDPLPSFRTSNGPNSSLEKEKVASCNNIPLLPLANKLHQNPLKKVWLYPKSQYMSSYFVNIPDTKEEETWIQGQFPNPFWRNVLKEGSSAAAGTEQETSLLRVARNND